jgi:hypothetical protein
VRRPACLELLPATAPVEPELPPMKPRRSNSIAPHRGTSHGSGGSLRRRLEEQRAYAAPAPFPLSFSVVSAPLCVIAAALRYIVCRKKVALPCYLFAANTARQPPLIARAPAGPASRTDSYRRHFATVESKARLLKRPSAVHLAAAARVCGIVRRPWRAFSTEP